MKTSGRMAIAAGALAILAGCATDRTERVEVEVRDQPAREQARDSGQAVGDSARDAGQAVGDTARDAGHAIGDAAQRAGTAIGDAAQQAGAKIDETKQEIDIRAALALDTSVDRSGIDVIGDEATRTIRLTGTVPTATQKTRAEEIAREKATGWTITNELQVNQTATNADGD